MISLRRKAGNAWRSLVQTYGTAAVKRRLWNAEFDGGRWNCLDATSGDCIYPYLEKYARHGAVLDLGCGSGSTASELDAGAYTSYVGVDISDIALHKARLRSERADRSAANVFHQSDIAAYVPERTFDVILFRDSLYYIPRHALLATLRRYERYLSDGGVFLVRLANGNDKYGALISLIEQHFTTIEKGSFTNPDAVVLVFRP